LLLATRPFQFHDYFVEKNPNPRQPELVFHFISSLCFSHNPVWAKKGRLIALARRIGVKNWDYLKRKSVSGQSSTLTEKLTLTKAVE